MAPLLDAAALGLGDATLESRLNEPLQVRIALVGAIFDGETLNATVGSEAQHSAAGIESVELLRRLRVEVFTPERGEGYVRVSTERSIREPVVSFLLVVENAREHVMREYTVLLDPPGYSLPTIARPRLQPQPQPQPRPQPEPQVPARRRAEPAPAARAPVASVAVSRPGMHPVHIGPVARGETLSMLAMKIRRDRGVTWAQMTWALFTANPHAFIDGDVNRLMSGVYLKVPSAASASRWSHREALALINGAPAQRQVAELSKNEPPPRGRAASTPASKTGNEAIVSSVPLAQATPAQASPAQATPAQATPAQATPETTSQPVVDPQPTPPQPLFRLATVDEFDAPRTDGSVGVSMTADERERIDQMIALANQQIQDSHEEIARARSQLAETAKQISSLVETVAKKDSEIKGLESRIADLRQLTKQQSIAMARSEPNWTHRLLLEAFLLAGMVVVLAVTLSRWTDARRRREARTEVETIVLESRPALVTGPAETVTTEIDDEIESRPDEEEPDPDPKTSTDEGLSLDHVELGEAAMPGDPLMEANAYFAYGYFEKAKEVLEKLIKENPAHAESRLVMLRVLHGLREKRRFRRHAEALLELVDGQLDERWNEAVRLGRALFPEERLFDANAYRRAEDEKWEETIWTGTRPDVNDSDEHVYLDLDEFKYVDLFLLDEAEDAETDGSLDTSSPEPAESENMEAELAKWRADMVGSSEDRGFMLDQPDAAEDPVDDEHS